MKFVINTTLNTWDEGDCSLNEEFEAKDWKEAEERAFDIYTSNDGEYNCDGYSIINLSTKEEREYEEEIHVSEEKIARINAILANAYPDEFNEV